MKTSYLFIRFFSTEFLHLPNMSLFHHWDEAAWLKLDKKKNQVKSLVNREKSSRASLELWKLLFTDDNQEPPPPHGFKWLMWKNVFFFGGGAPRYIRWSKISSLSFNPIYEEQSHSSKVTLLLPCNAWSAIDKNQTCKKLRMLHYLDFLNFLNLLHLSSMSGIWAS